MAESDGTVIAFPWPEEEFRATGLARPAGYAMRFGHSGDRAAAEAARAGADYIVRASGFGKDNVDPAARRVIIGVHVATRADADGLAAREPCYMVAR